MPLYASEMAVLLEIGRLSAAEQFLPSDWMDLLLAAIRMRDSRV